MGGVAASNMWYGAGRFVLATFFSISLPTVAHSEGTGEDRVSVSVSVLWFDLPYATCYRIGLTVGFCIDFMFSLPCPIQLCMGGDLRVWLARW